MKLTEFRFLLPLSLDEHHRGKSYAVAELSKSETSGGEGVEFVTDDVRDHPILGKNIRYTKKYYHLGG